MKVSAAGETGRGEELGKMMMQSSVMTSLAGR
jgi:hypothetical protein